MRSSRPPSRCLTRHSRTCWDYRSAFIEVLDVSQETTFFLEHSQDDSVIVVVIVALTPLDLEAPAARPIDGIDVPFGDRQRHPPAIQLDECVGEDLPDDTPEEHSPTDDGHLDVAAIVIIVDDRALELALAVEQAQGEARLAEADAHAMPGPGPDLVRGIA